MQKQTKPQQKRQCMTKKRIGKSLINQGTQKKDAILIKNILHGTAFADNFSPSQRNAAFINTITTTNYEQHHYYRYRLPYQSRLRIFQQHSPCPEKWIRDGTAHLRQFYWPRVSSPIGF
jgi:hypothetical protein